MKLNAKRFLYCLTIVVAFVATLVWRAPFKIQTDLTSLIETNTVSNQWPIHKISNQFSSTVNIIVESDDEKSAQKYANQISNIINDSGFNTLTLQTNNFSLKNIVRDLIPYKNGLISEKNRELLKNGEYKKIADNAISVISESMMPLLVPMRDDPFLLLSDYIMNINNTNPIWTLRSGMLWQNRDGIHYFMLPVNSNATNATENANQIILLYSQLKQNTPENIKIYISGIPLHTAIMVHKSQLQLGILSAIALLMAILFNYLLFKKLFTLIPVLTSLFVGFLSGTIALFLFFNAPHILTFVFGTTLIGLGIDYSFHFLSAASLKKRDQIYKNMFHSFLTTIACFLPLLFSSVSLLQQISLFTIVGLSAIYTGLKLFMPNKLNLNIKPLKNMFAFPQKTRIKLIGVICVAIIATLPFVKTQNSMNQFYRASPEIVAQDLFFQKLNNSQKTAVLMVRGQSVQDILETEEEIKSNGIDFISISSFIPSIKTQIETQKLTQQLYDSQSRYLKKKLELKNAPAFQKSKYLSVININDDFIKDWIDKLIIRDNGYIYSIAQINPNINIENENAKIVSVSEMMQNQIQKYSVETYSLLFVCAIFLMGLLAILYKKRFIVYLIPSILAILLSVSVLTWFNCPITFFHMLSFFIVIGLGLDYTIFNINANNAQEMRPVLFSFLTSFVGFGLLSFTSFFLIKSMGITLALGLGLSYLISLFLFKNTRHRKRS